jgi:hypothetical protein
MRNGTMNLQKQINTLQKDVANIINATGSLITHKASDAKDLVVDTGSSAVMSFAKTIKKSPIAAVGVAFGLGYLAMRLIRR